VPRQPDDTDRRREHDVTTTARGFTPGEKLLIAELRARHAARIRDRRAARAAKADPVAPAEEPALSDDELLRTDEVAKLLQMSTRTVLGWAQDGKLRSILTPGGHRRFFASSVLAVRERMWEGGEP
jgi:excisionase family DNA binding protein